MASMIQFQKQAKQIEKKKGLGVPWALNIFYEIIQKTKNLA